MITVSCIHMCLLRNVHPYNCSRYILVRCIHTCVMHVAILTHIPVFLTEIQYLKSVFQIFIVVHAWKLAFLKLIWSYIHIASILFN